MMRQSIPALSVSQTLLADLAGQPFSGRVVGLFNRACNLVDSRGRLITVGLPAVGNGPFTILIEGRPGLFNTLSLNQPIQANHRLLKAGSWRISLDQARVWPPKIAIPPSPPSLSFLIHLAQPYAEWPLGLNEETPLGQTLARRAGEAARRLNRAISQTPVRQKVEAAAAQLAGLGQGLTPAGDDYLIGVMAALWLTGQKEFLAPIAAAAIPKTTALSAAFLRAAARGEFTEPWHALAWAWLKEDSRAMAGAIETIAKFGASSGVDALAGFANALLSLTGCATYLP